MQEQELSVGDVARRSGVAVSALHFYERKGLISSLRTAGNQRRYARDVLRRLAVIRVAQRVGMPLEAVARAFETLPQGRAPTKADWARLSARWQQELEERIHMLQLLRDELTGCIGCGCLSLSVDYYRIELEEMIKDLDRDEILSAEAGCRTGTTISGGAWNNPGGAGYCDTITSRVLRNADGTIASIERGPINLAQMETSGIDASLKYRLATAGWGNFQLSLDYNNLLAYREQIYRTDSDENRRDERVRSRVRGSVHWDNGGAWDWTVYFRRLGSMRAVNWGTCERFDDGYQPSASDACVVTDTANVHLGESSKRYFGRVGPAIYWNLSTGYRITDHAKVNFYVNNVFNEVGYENKERFYGYGFYNTTLFNPIGREVAAEYVFTF